MNCFINKTFIAINMQFGFVLMISNGQDLILSSIYNDPDKIPFKSLRYCVIDMNIMSHFTR